MHTLKRLIPKPLYQMIAPLYHHALAWVGAQLYGHPSKKINVVAITGTKGKSSVSELVHSILEHAGYKTALVSTIHFKMGSHSEPNKLKMTMPGRFFLQKFLKKAVDANCDWAVIEMTSEGASQFRHINIETDALIFTNITPEHIESHGSFENYLAAKLSIGKALEKSKKPSRIIVANADDEHGADFLALHVDRALPFTLEYAKPWSTTESGTQITFEGTTIHSPIPGEFTAYNMLAAATFARAIGVGIKHIKAGLEATQLIPGRVEPIAIGQDFKVIVDYAHTIESLEKLYQAFPNKKKICVLGNTGGGRDTWKRPKMAALAEKYCERVILTDEDPYDEDPESIVQEMAAGMNTRPEIIMDRRRAIRAAIELAKGNAESAVLITGKGTDPYIMRANGDKEPWSDATVAREELQAALGDTKSAATI
ncbi:UDP-N-acetylmuramoyl-L-alanyl-D-glutamate--2,6-diaminopimelate ligase [Candidatus Kaiserbacteria bacterium]|nr:MAG: UDP-N-acetylmuramoyl-L-alanyl-D-glutamate--2,6-diaminopimelate ligase [Candidatus Kaiserbacteria bacterium]